MCVCVLCVGLRLKATALGQRVVDPSDPNQQLVSDGDDDELLAMDDSGKYHSRRRKRRRSGSSSSSSSDDSESRSARELVAALERAVMQVRGTRVRTATCHRD